jgi:hypothetical protein
VSVATSSLLPEPARRRHEEDDLQRTVVEYLDLALPPDGVVFAIPNGGLRHKKLAARLKGLGVKAGVPDLEVIWRGRSYFVELKAHRGVMSPAQRSMAQRLVYCGAPVCCCRSGPEVEAALREQGVPLRARFA